jgi:hypothetical protein
VLQVCHTPRAQCCIVSSYQCNHHRLWWSVDLFLRTSKRLQPHLLNPMPCVPDWFIFMSVAGKLSLTIIHAVLAEMAAECYAQDSSLLHRLQQLYEKYGYMKSIGGYVTATSPDVMREVFCDIRGRGSTASYPQSIAGARGVYAWSQSSTNGIVETCRHCREHQLSADWSNFACFAQQRSLRRTASFEH